MMSYLTVRKSSAILMASIAALLASCADTTPKLKNSAEAADLIFVNAKVITVDSNFSIAQAFAIKEGRFIHVGKQTEAMAYAGPNTQVIDLKGRTVIPGLADSHLHTAGGGPYID